MVGCSYPREKFVRTASMRRAVDAAEGRRHEYISQDRQTGKEVEILKDDPYIVPSPPVARRFAEGGQLNLPPRDSPGVKWLNTGQGVDERSLPCA